MAIRRIPVFKKVSRSAKPKAKPPDVIFDRSKRIPLVVREAADLWLDLFTGISDTIAPERTEDHPSVSTSCGKYWLGVAAELADHALELYETRWPHASHGKGQGD